MNPNPPAPTFDPAATQQDRRPILVLGATGKTGRRVVSALGSMGVPTRAASRSSATPFDWGDPDTWAPALEGVQAAYVVPPEFHADVDHFVALAHGAGAERLVLLSARQPNQGGDDVIPTVEAAVRRGPVPATIVQPSWFVQNFTEGMFADELATGVLRLPVGDGREPFVDTADIASVVVAALTGDGHAGATYELSGPELLTFGEAVGALARLTGRELRFEPIDPEPWADATSAFLPVPVVELLLNLFAAIRDGANDYLSPGVEQALGRPARSLAEAVAADLTAHST